MNHNKIAIACAGELKTIIKEVIITNSEDFDKLVEEIIDLTSSKDIYGLSAEEIVLDIVEFRRVYSFLVHNCTIDIKNE